MKYEKPELAVLNAACAAIHSDGSKDGPTFEITQVQSLAAYEADE